MPGLCLYEGMRDINKNDPDLRGLCCTEVRLSRETVMEKMCTEDKY